MHKVHIIGIGAGTPDYLLPIAKKEIGRADCLIGGKRQLSLFKRLKKEKICLEGHFNDVILYIKENLPKKRIAVLVSGDPGLYSFLGQIEKSLKKETYAVIPGISAMQVAFARIGESWQDAKIISLHGRNINKLAREVRPASKAFLFTDSRFSPQKIAAYLLNKKIGNRRAFVFENLGYPDERIVDTGLDNLFRMEGSGLCVMIIKKEKA